MSWDHRCRKPCPSVSGKVPAKPTHLVLAPGDLQLLRGGVREASGLTTRRGGCQGWGARPSCKGAKDHGTAAPIPTPGPRRGADSMSCFPPGPRRRPNLPRQAARAGSGLLWDSRNSEAGNHRWDKSHPAPETGPSKQRDWAVRSQATGSPAGLQREVRPCSLSNCNRRHVAGSGWG